MHAILDSPQHHPACCLGLSLKLFQIIENLIRGVRVRKHGDILVLSIGCGTGFFEAQLDGFLRDQRLDNVQVEGVELHTTKTPYLHYNSVRRVRGTWDVLDGARDADLLMFVYPRAGSLVKQYLELFHESVSAALWLGPRADWVEQEPMLHNIATFSQPLLLDNGSLASYEIGVRFENNRFKTP